jgi:hypothetical protein
MAAIKFRYEWYDQAHTVMRLIALDDWNWKDYHAAARVATFAMINHPGGVHTLIDFRQQTRPALPAGLAAHMSSFGKRITPALSGYVVVLGTTAQERAQLPLNAAGQLETKDGRVYFAETDQEAEHLLQQIQQMLAE